MLCVLVLSFNVIYNSDFLSHEVPSRSDVRPCIKLDKPLVVFIPFNSINMSI